MRNSGPTLVALAVLATGAALAAAGQAAPGDRIAFA